MPASLKSAGLLAMHRCGVFSALRYIQRRRTLVLAYHGVLTTDRAESAYLDYNFLSAELFDEQIRHLRRRYRPIALSEFIEASIRGASLPERSVVVTFDDGFANNYRVAFPILRTHGVPFAVFLTTGMIGTRGGQLWSERVSRAVFLTKKPVVELGLGGRAYRFALPDAVAREQASRSLVAALKRTPPTERNGHVAAIEQAFARPDITASEHERYDFLTWDEVREMAAAGVEFGSHTVNHPILSTLDEPSLERELVDSKCEIESQLGTTCDAFAYPNGGVGDFGPREERALRAAGYRCGFALIGGLVASKANPFALRRVNIGRNFDCALFEAATTGLLESVQKVRALAFPTRMGAPDRSAEELRPLR